MDKLLGRKELVGIDIGSHSIKLARGQAGRGSVELTHLTSTPTPAGLIENGVVQDAEKLAVAVGEVVSSAGLEGMPVATGVTDPHMVATTIQMPRAMQSTILTSIQFEARKHVPFDVDQSVVECQVLDPDDKQNEQMTVLLVAVRRDAVEGRVQALRAAGLDPVWVDAKQFATMRATLYANQEPATFGQTLALVRIGGSFTEITMTRKGAFVFARIVPIAGANMDRALAAALTVDPEEARRLKEERAIACTRDQLSSLPEESRQVSQVIAPVLEEIVRDVQRSFNFLASRLNLDPSAPVVDRVLLTGGGAMMRGIDRFMSSQLEAPVEVFNLFRSLPVTAASYDASYLAALGPSCVAAVGLAIAEMMQRGQFPLSGQPESDALLVEGAATAAG